MFLHAENTGVSPTLYFGSLIIAVLLTAIITTWIVVGKKSGKR